MSTRAVLVVVACAVGVAACSGDDDDAGVSDDGTTVVTNVDESRIDEDTSDDPVETTSPTTEPPATTEPPTTTAPPATTQPATTTTTTTVPGAVLEIPGTDPIVLLTAESGGGDRPLLAWEPTDAATTYYVVVYDENGDLYWATVTPATEVYVGGATQIPADNDGPRIAADYSWVVYADDADGAPVGASPRLTISP